MPFRPWTEEEKEVVRQLLGKMPTKEICKLIDRPYGGIFYKIRTMRDSGETELRVGTGNKFRSNVWTPTQIEALKANYATLSSGDLAEIIGRDLHSVYQMAYKLKLTRKKTSEGDYLPMQITISQGMIDRYLAGTPMRFLYEELGVSWHLFRKALKRQGVRSRTRKEISMLHLDRLQAGSIRARKDPDWKKRMSATLQGIPIEDWTGFKNKEYDFLRYKPEWKAWRRAIFKRDSHTCVMCKVHRPRILDPHHIIRKSERPDLMYDVDNGVALCRHCHSSITHHEEDYAPRFRAHVESLKEIAASQTNLWEESRV